MPPRLVSFVPPPSILLPPSQGLKLAPVTDAGQGSAQAFEDAETLSHFMSHLALEEALDRFEQARKPRAHYVQSTGRVLNGCLSIDGWNEHHYYTTIYTWKGCGMT